MPFHASTWRLTWPIACVLRVASNPGTFARNFCQDQESYAYLRSCILLRHLCNWQNGLWVPADDGVGPNKPTSNGGGGIDGGRRISVNHLDNLLLVDKPKCKAFPSICSWSQLGYSDSVFVLNRITPLPVLNKLIREM